MCHPANYNRQLDVKKARKVVKKYRQMSYKKEMNRLRSLLAVEESVSEYNVLDQTVSLIQELESRLIAQLQRGKVPEKMLATGVNMDWSQCNHDTIRNIVGIMMSPTNSS